MRRRTRGGDAVTFDFAPMVDVVLLLLIFFFLTSSLAPRDRALPLTLPGSSTSVQDSASLPVVSLDTDGKVYLNGEATTLARLAGQLRPLLTASNRAVGLRADERGQYGAVMKVMDEIRRAGGEKLALATRAAP